VHTVEIGVPFGERKTWLAAMNVHHVGSYYLDSAKTARYPGHWVANLRLSWTAPALRLTLRVDNLFDTAYADRADFAFGNHRYFPARGRAAFLSVDYSSD
jgi:outer membrane receptor protein involved in Fe transport